MKKILLALAVLALLGGRAHATNASPSVITSTAPANPGSVYFLAAPSSGFYNVLTGCYFANGYSAGECATISSSVSGEPSFELCAPSSSTVSTGGSVSVAQGRNVNSIASTLGINLVYSGNLTVTGTATQSNILLVCGYRTTNGIN